MDERQCGALALLHIGAVFDTDMYSLLLADLEKIGINEEALKHLRNDLETEAYHVQIDHFQE